MAKPLSNGQNLVKQGPFKHVKVGKKLTLDLICTGTLLLPTQKFSSRMGRIDEFHEYVL